MQNNETEPLEPQEKQKPFLKRIANMEKEIERISKRLDTISKSLRR